MCTWFIALQRQKIEEALTWFLINMLHSLFLYEEYTMLCR
jgi:hypothetical protein